MQVKINIKGIAKRQKAIVQINYQYSKANLTVQEFLTETVRQNVQDYNERKDNAEILKLFSKEYLDEQAMEGKVAGIELRDERKADLNVAIENALQCFADGMVALFIDGKQFEQLTDQIELQPNSEATFVKLTFLAGRMW